MQEPRNSQLAALGGLACSIGIPAHEWLEPSRVNDDVLSHVFAGYSIGRQLNVVKRSEVSEHDDRMKNQFESFRELNEDAYTKNEETKVQSEALLERLRQDSENQQSSWTQFFESANEEWTRLRTTFDVQLRLEAPANYWGKEAKKSLWAAMGWLALFGVFAAAIISALVLVGLFVLENITNIAKVNAYASVLMISLPALTALWALRQVARLFVTNLERSNDARMGDYIHRLTPV